MDGHHGHHGRPKLGDLGELGITCQRVGLEAKMATAEHFVVVVDSIAIEIFIIVVVTYVHIHSSSMGSVCLDLGSALHT